MVIFENDYNDLFLTLHKFRHFQYLHNGTGRVLMLSLKSRKTTLILIFCRTSSRSAVDISGTNDRAKLKFETRVLIEAQALKKACGENSILCQKLLKNCIYLGFLGILSKKSLTIFSYNIAFLGLLILQYGIYCVSLALLEEGIQQSI